MSLKLRLFAVAFAALTLSAPVRADVLDSRLLVEVPKVLDAVRQRGWNNVGVLKFEVQRGGDEGPVTMTAGSLNSMMATRLENALILASDKAPIGVVRAASEVAARRDPKAGYHSDAARRALLVQKYPLAWGSDSVAVDGFVTGRVTFSPDYKTATVILRAFGKDALKPAEIAHFETRVERSLLVDLNQPFAAPMAEVRQRLLLLNPNAPAAAPQVEDIVLEDAQKSAKTADAPARTGVAEPRVAVQAAVPAAVQVKKALDDILKVEIIYGGKVMEWTADNRLPPPEAKQKVEIRLRAAERLGVVLRVNGVNSADNDRDERPIQEYSMWVLEKDVDYVVRGFYTPDNQVIFFTGEKREDVNRSELGDERRIGRIDVDVFQAPPDGVKLADAARPADLREKAAAEDVDELRGKLRSLSARKVTVRPRQLIVGGDAEKVNVRTAEFKGIHTIHLPIIYSDPCVETPRFLPPDNE